jgi:type IV pilus assembly protein PilM
VSDKSKRSVWKKDLSFRRKPKPFAGEEARVEQPPIDENERIDALVKTAVAAAIQPAVTPEAPPMWREASPAITEPRAEVEPFEAPPVSDAIELPPVTFEHSPESHELPAMLREPEPEPAPAVEEHPPVSQELPPVSYEAPPAADELPPVSEVFDLPPVSMEPRSASFEPPPAAEELPPVMAELPPMSREVVAPAIELPAAVVEELPPVSEPVPPAAEDLPPVAVDLPPVSREVVAPAIELPAAVVEELPPVSEPVPPAAEDLPPTAEAAAQVVELPAPEPAAAAAPEKKRFARKPRSEQPKQKQQKQPKQKKEKKQKPAKPKRQRRKLSLKAKLPALKRTKRAKRGGQVPGRIVGLKIGASQIAAARVTNNGSAELVQIAREPLEQGVVVGGELRDPAKLTAALSDFFRKNDLPKSNVRLGIASNRIGVRTFDIEGVDDTKQLDNAVRFRAQETLPIPIDDAVLDYQILNHTKKENGDDTKRVLLVVAYRDLVDHYVGACRNAGIDLVGIDLEAFALLRAMGAPGDTESGAALIVVAVGHDRSTFAVSNGRACEFTRVLEWGGGSLDIALGRALEIEPAEAESLKRTIDLETSTPPPGMTDSQLELAQDAIRRQIQTFARDLVSSLQFYQNQPGSLAIGEIVITGGTSHLPGLAEELESLIGVTVRVGDPLQRVRVADQALADDEQIGSLAVAIGLGIED